MLDSSDLIMNTSDGIRRLSKWDLFYETGRKPFYYRGKSLGNTVTEDQLDAIYKADFSDLCIGDFWLDNNKRYWIIGDWDVLYNQVIMRNEGGIYTDHHILVYCVTPYTKVQYHSVRDISSVGYANCDWRTGNGENDARGKMRRDIYNVFGEENVMHYYDMLANGYNVDQNFETFTNYECDVELPCEAHLFGRDIRHAKSNHFGTYISSVINGPFALYAIPNHTTYFRDIVFLRDISWRECVSSVDVHNWVYEQYVDQSFAMCPFFLLKGKPKTA